MRIDSIIKEHLMRMKLFHIILIFIKLLPSDGNFTQSTSSKSSDSGEYVKFLPRYNIVGCQNIFGVEK